MYGVAGPNSDYDVIEIHDQCKPSHRVSELYDETRWPLSMFMKFADKGGHNALQMMFADPDWCEIDLLKDMRQAYRTNLWICYARFEKVRQTYLARGDDKGRRYAIMFEKWMEQIAETGRFDPHNKSIMDLLR